MKDKIQVKEEGKKDFNINARGNINDPTVTRNKQDY